MDDWEKYENLAENLKYRNDFEFAMFGAKNFGMKAVPILSAAPSYGDNYSKLIKQACETSISKGNSYGRTCDIDKDFLIRSELGQMTVHLCEKNFSTEKVINVPSFELKKMSSFCDQRIHEIKVERLHEKITSKLAVKHSPPSRGIKI